MLSIDEYFETGIHGAVDDILDCSKELVIKNILKDIQPKELLSFGDGYVEIELVSDLADMRLLWQQMN